jgi:hypothetical protein
MNDAMEMLNIILNINLPLVVANSASSFYDTKMNKIIYKFLYYY